MPRKKKTGDPLMSEEGLFSSVSDRTTRESSLPKKESGFQTLGTLFSQFQLQDKGGYITQEFQDFGYRMAMELDDNKRVSLYMRLAKKEKRGLLEKALSFVSDAPNVKNRAALFMWKLKELKKGEKE